MLNGHFPSSCRKCLWELRLHLCTSIVIYQAVYSWSFTRFEAKLLNHLHLQLCKSVQTRLSFIVRVQSQWLCKLIINSAKPSHLMPKWLSFLPLCIVCQGYCIDHFTYFRHQIYQLTQTSILSPGFQSCYPNPCKNNRACRTPVNGSSSYCQ